MDQRRHGKNVDTDKILTLVVLPLVDILEIVDARIVVILAGEDNLIKVAGVHVGNGMTVRVVPTKACLESAVPGTGIHQTTYRDPGLP